MGSCVCGRRSVRNCDFECHEGAEGVSWAVWRRAADVSAAFSLRQHRGKLQMLTAGLAVIRRIDFLQCHQCCLFPIRRAGISMEVIVVGIILPIK